jgi:hypothetical protein
MRKHTCVSNSSNTGTNLSDANFASLGHVRIEISRGAFEDNVATCVRLPTLYEGIITGDGLF